MLAIETIVRNVQTPGSREQVEEARRNHHGSIDEKDRAEVLRRTHGVLDEADGLAFEGAMNDSRRPEAHG